MFNSIANYLFGSPSEVECAGSSNLSDPSTSHSRGRRSPDLADAGSMRHGCSPRKPPKDSWIFVKDSSSGGLVSCNAKSVVREKPKLSAKQLRQQQEMFKKRTISLAFLRKTKKKEPRYCRRPKRLDKQTYKAVKLQSEIDRVGIDRVTKSCTAIRRARKSRERLQRSRSCESRRSRSGGARSASSRSSERSPSNSSVYKLSRSRKPSAVKNQKGPEFSEEYIQKFLDMNQDGVRTPQSLSDSNTTSNPLTDCFRKYRNPSPGSCSNSNKLPIKGETRLNPPKKPSVAGARSRSSSPRGKRKTTKKKSKHEISEEIKNITAGASRVPRYEDEAEAVRFPFNLFPFGSKKEEPAKKIRLPRKKKDPELPLTDDMKRKGSKRVKVQMSTGETVDVRRSSRKVSELGDKGSSSKKRSKLKTALKGRKPKSVESSTRYSLADDEELDL